MVTQSVDDTQVVVETPPESPPVAEAQLVGEAAPSTAAPTSPEAPPPSGAPAEATGPYDLPPDFDTPQAPGAPPPGLTDIEAQELAYYRRRNQEWSLQEQERNLDNYYQQAVQYYTNPANGFNYDEQTVQAVAQVHRQERAGALQREVQYRAEAQAATRSQQEAQQVARQFNINPALLAGFQRREDMVRHAAVVRHYGDYRKTTDARLSALEKRRVPEQQFAGGGTGGIPPATADNIDRLWFEFETQHPGQANPYEKAYRKAMER